MRIDRRSTIQAGLGRRAVMRAGAAGIAAAVMPRIARAQPDGEPIPIGVAAPLTAQFAQDGVWMKNGIGLAIKAINDRGGIRGRKLRVYFEDDQGPNPTAGANAVTKLITQYNVVALLGPHFTPAILPSEPMLAQYKVPTLTGASGPIVTQQKNPFVFRVRLNDTAGAALLVKYVVETLGWKKIGVAYVNTAFGQSGNSAIKQALSENGITPAVTQTHRDGTKDFTSQLLNFQQAGVDGVIAWTDDQPGGLLAKQRATLAMPFGLAGSTTLSQPPFLSLAGEAANGVYAITDFIVENDAPEVAAWKKLYADACHEPPELYSSTYYDATNLLAWAIGEAASVTGPDIRDALAKVNDRPGVKSRYTWSPTGDLVHSGLITVIRNEHPTVASVVST